MRNVSKTSMFVANTLILASVCLLSGCLDKDPYDSTNQTQNASDQATGGHKLNQAKRDFRLICLQEGNGRIDLAAYNKGENAKGPAQIRPDYLTDSNVWAAQHGYQTYTHDDCYDYDVSLAVCISYWNRYNLHTLELRARGHCGGPDGPWQSCTLPYWRSLKTRM